MKTIRGYLARWRCVGLAGVLACLGPGLPVFAQSVPIVERLSPNTVFYVDWRGSASLVGAAQKNHVLQLLHDPALASIWSAAAVDFEQRLPKSAGPAAASLASDVASLLDNPLVFGVVTNPDAVTAAAPDKPASPFGAFVVYDATGKADLVQKWKAIGAANNNAPAEITKYDFGGTSVEMRTQGKNVSYSALAANYYLFSDQKQVIEDLIARFRGGDRPASSLAQLPQYDEMRKYVGSNAALEFFGRIPDMNQLNLADKTWKSTAEFAKSLHLEKIHVMGGALSFDEEATRFRGAILGDTSRGGPFDLAAESRAAFQTQPIAEAGPAFSMSRINLPAAYRFIRGAVLESLPAQQSANVAMMESAAQSYLGMPIADALDLFTGEFASTSSYSDDGTPEQVFAVTIQKPDAVLRILRAVIGTMIVGEDVSGSTTYLDLAYPYTDPQTHLKRRKSYYVAVTQQMILAAPRKAMLREAMQRFTPETTDPPTGVFANPQYAQLRSLLPEKLSGLSGADISQIPWDKILNKFVSQLPQNANQPPLALRLIKPELISHYLHIWVSGWWKDASGVYFDTYVQ